MKRELRRIGNTQIIVDEGDITRIQSDALITAINAEGVWAGGIDGAIARVAGDHYHRQAAAQMPLHNLQTIIARGGARPERQMRFRDVVFVVDELESPLAEVVYTSLEASHKEGYRSILLPTIRMGVMLGVVEKSPEEAVDGMSTGVKDFMKKYGSKTKLEEMRFVVYNDPFTAGMLSASLEKSLEDFPTASPRGRKETKRGQKKTEAEANRLELPHPQYLQTAPDTTGSGDIKWIGIKAPGLTGEEKNFLWWRNFKADLNDTQERYDVAAFITRLYLGMGAESACGLPLDLHGSDQSIGRVAVISDPSVAGMYVEASKRPMFNFMVSMEGLGTETQMRRKHKNFDEILQRAHENLPYAKRG